MNISQFLRTRFTTILLAFVVLGFIVPGVEHIPAQVMILFLAILIFVSAFQISLGEVKAISPWHPAVFYLLRYPVLAVLLWLIVQGVYPALATAVLLLSLAPAGVASPGVTSIYNGNVSLSILIVVISAFLAPFLIPVVLQLLVARHIDLDILSIFRTLLISVFVPLIAHLPLRRRPAAQWLRKNDSLFVVPAIGILVMLVISKQKSFIIAHAVEAAAFFAVAIVIFLLYYTFGWLLFPGTTRRDRVSYALGSGVNNTAIVIVLAYLYFSPEVSTFLITSELAWVGSMVIFKRFLDSRISRQTEPSGSA